MKVRGLKLQLSQKKLLIKGNTILNQKYTSTSYQPSKHARKKYRLMCL